MNQTIVSKRNLHVMFWFFAMWLHWSSACIQLANSITCLDWRFAFACSWGTFPVGTSLFWWKSSLQYQPKIDRVSFEALLDKKHLPSLGAFCRTYLWLLKLQGQWTSVRFTLVWRRPAGRRKVFITFGLDRLMWIRCSGEFGKEGISSYSGSNRIAPANKTAHIQRGCLEWMDHRPGNHGAFIEAWLRVSCIPFLQRSKSA